MGRGIRTLSWLLAILLISATAVTPVLAEEHGFFGKLKLAMDYLKDPGLLIAYIKNEFIDPLLHKDPYSKYKEIVKKSGTTPTSEPSYMKKVREKLNSYFARLDGYNLTADQLEAICRMGVSDVTLAVMDSQRTYYIKHIYISGDVVRVDGRATPNMVSITPRAAYELVLMLDDYFEDGYLSNAELKSLGNWGLSKYKSGEISGKKSHIEAILNFLISSGGGEG